MSITLDQVTKRYAGAPVVNDVSLDIGDGEFFVLLGPSGSGMAASRCTAATSRTSPPASAAWGWCSRTTRCSAI
jgi:ABC-type phosphate/phosphonate transport system ATPase subunit